MGRDVELKHILICFMMILGLISAGAFNLRIGSIIWDMNGTIISLITMKSTIMTGMGRKRANP